MSLRRTWFVKSIVVTALAFLLSPSLIHAGCGGVLRWAIKVGSDDGAAHINLGNITTITITDWNNLARPDQIQSGSRQGPEVTVYQVTGYLIGYKKQADEDFHLIVNERQDGAGKSLVAEVVNPNCIKGKNDDGGKSHFEKQLKQVATAFENLVRDADMTGDNLDEPIKVTITGVGFFDKPHGKGQADNTLEIHPVLDIK